jgi:hypothetical protein
MAYNVSHMHRSRICGVTNLTLITAAREGYKRLNTCGTAMGYDAVLHAVFSSCRSFFIKFVLRLSISQAIKSTDYQTDKQMYRSLRNYPNIYSAILSAIYLPIFCKNYLRSTKKLNRKFHFILR